MCNFVKQVLVIQKLEKCHSRNIVVSRRKLMQMPLFYWCKLKGAQKSWLNNTAMSTKQKSCLKMFDEHRNKLDKKGATVTFRKLVKIHNIYNIANMHIIINCLRI